MTPRLPRRHVIRPAASAAAAAPGAGAAPATGTAPGRRPQRVCIMVEPSPFTYVCGYVNRYKNMIRFLTEAGVEVLVVTPGPGVTVPGERRQAGGREAGRAAWVPCASACLGVRCAGDPRLTCRPPAVCTPCALAPHPRPPARPPPAPGVDFSAAREQPAEFEGARVVQAFSVGLPWYLSLPLSFGLSPRIYREIK